MISKIFKAYDVRGVYPDPLNENDAWCIGYAAGQFFRERNGDKPGTVAVSRDMRKSSPSLCGKLIEGVRSAGMDVVDLGMCDTSFIYFAVNHLDAIGGIQTTASHNPPRYNGFKICGAKAAPIGQGTGLEKIQELAEAATPGSAQPTGSLKELDLWQEYREHVLQFLPEIQRPLKVFVDASNGMAGKMVPALFDGVKNLTIVPLNFEITGEFVHEPNPLEHENMIPTEEGVVEHHCDMGVCFDGDADRCMIVDDQGQTVGCDHLTGLLAEHFLAIERTNPAAHGGAIVYDLRSSKAVEEVVTGLGATPRRSRVGHVFMKHNMAEVKAIFGGELSGHFYFRDNFYADSGAIAFASVLTVLGSSDQKLSERVAPLRKYPQSGEINFTTEDKKAVMAELKSRYDGQARIDELDGVTVDAFEGEGWWFNVRASNTEPLLRLNAEARDKATLQRLVEEITPLLGEPATAH